MNEQEKYDWMVYVSCMTFNQAQYIEDAMNGFTMQETNFPFVCAVVDDASTDGEQEVIKSYLDEHFDLEDKNVVRHEETDDYVLTFARHKTNKNCYFAVLYLKYNHWTAKKKKAPYFAQWREKAKYIALCEGDDYWINSEKLQDQVNYLEEHPNIVLTCHRFKVFDQDTFSFSDDGHDAKFKSGENGFVFSYQQNEGWLTKTLTIVYRSCYYVELQKIRNGLDSVHIYILMKHGDAYIHNKVWGVYRKHIGGIYSKNTLKNNVKRAYKAYKMLYYYDPNKTTRSLYYNSYANMFYVSRGKILSEEKFELRKFLSLGYYYTLKMYRLLFNKKS